MVTCFSCGQTLRFEGVLGRSAQCPHCVADVRVCKNCERCDERAYNGCREPMAERVKDPTRANFCEYFEPRALGHGQNQGQDQGQAGSRSPAELARARLEALFGGGGGGGVAGGDDDAPPQGCEDP